MSETGSAMHCCRICRAPCCGLKMYDYLGPDLTEKAGRLPEGGISDAIAAGEGWHFLHIVRKQASAPPAFEDIRPQIVDALRGRATMPPYAIIWSG